MAPPAAAQQDSSIDRIVESRKTIEYGTCAQGALAIHSVPQQVACLADEFQRQDIEMQRLLRIVLRRADESKREALARDQRKWTKARDPACRAQEARYRGPADGMVVRMTCRVDFTIRRAILLETLR